MTLQTYQISLQYRGVDHPIALKLDELLSPYAALTKLRETLKLKSQTNITVVGSTAFVKNDDFVKMAVINSAKDVRHFVVNHKSTQLVCRQVLKELDRRLASSSAEHFHYECF
jgi:hypothetical protein